MFVLLFIPSLASATSLFQDPSREDLNALLNSYDKKDLACTPGCSADGDRKNYIVSILALSDKKNNFGISKDCDKSVRNLKGMWREGINDAGYDLARMYYYGVCVNVDLTKTRQLLLTSANNGYVPAQKLLGKSYWREETLGKLYSEDNEKAAFWLSKSAASGDAESAAMISAFYRKGIYFEKDPVKSFYWINKAFDSKYGSGLGAYTLDLADFYENGYGTEKDLILSYKFYDLSGTAGIEGKNRISKDMTEGEIQEAIKQSHAWQEEHNTFVPSYYGLEHQSDGSYR
ncbi:tetratricopeptide repeat protein [Cobetia sp. MMG027]|uniref:tetratricopeptide repeat protein n=1 Tax=Cobetia sp. MMG027 TaxID=3021980 RepID=UPI0022FEA424|nr:tetratricopeptide repeat protein [Cobetia sp. MMG027]MDA5562429.1 tetratricopeptide repeat protein [Cobetia sp. MMG027]